MAKYFFISQHHSSFFPTSIPFLRLRSLYKDLTENPDAWQKLHVSSNPIDSLPAPYNSANPIAKLAILKWLRPDVLLISLKQQLSGFYGNEIGTIETQTINLSDVFASSAAKIPIVIFKVASSNSSADIFKLAEEINAAER